MSKIYSSVEAAQLLGISPNYATRFFKAHGVERTLGIYVIDEPTLKRLNTIRSAAARKVLS